MMTATKEPKVYHGRINRTVKLPTGLHSKVKALASSRLIPISHFYDEIIRLFLQEREKSSKKTDYLFHRGTVATVAISLKKDLVYDIKSIASEDSVSENRAIFTAIMHFSKNNSLITD